MQTPLCGHLVAMCKQTAVCKEVRSDGEPETYTASFWLIMYWAGAGSLMKSPGGFVMLPSFQCHTVARIEIVMRRCAVLELSNWNSLFHCCKIADCQSLPPSCSWWRWWRWPFWGWCSPARINHLKSRLFHASIQSEWQLNQQCPACRRPSITRRRRRIELPR